MTITVPEATEVTEQPAYNHRAEFITGLHQIADFLTVHPEVELPWLGAPAALNIFLVSGDQRAALATIARAMGRAEKQVKDYGNGSSSMVVSRRFAGVTLAAHADRDEVCERVVTGTAEVTTEVPDPELLAQVPKVTQTQVVETVEWRCVPLLADDTRAALGELVQA